MVPLCSTLSFSQNASGAACAFYAGRSCWSVAIDWGITPVGGVIHFNWGVHFSGPGIRPQSVVTGGGPDG